MPIAETLQKLCPMLLGIHREQPYVSFIFQHTNVSKQYKAVVGGMRQYVAGNIPGLIKPISHLVVLKNT